MVLPTNGKRALAGQVMGGNKKAPDGGACGGSYYGRCTPIAGYLFKYLDGLPDYAADAPALGEGLGLVVGVQGL